MTSVSKYIIKFVFLWGALGAYFMFIVNACEPEAPYINEGRLYLYKGKYDKAEKKFTRYVKRYPAGTDLVRARFLLAKSHLGRGQYAEATKLFGEVIKKHGKTTEAKKSLYKLALIQLFQGQPRSAARYASRVESATSNSMKGEASALRHWLAGGLSKVDTTARARRRNTLDPKRGGKLVKNGVFRSAIPYLLNRSGDKTHLFLGKAWLGLHDFDQAHHVFSGCARRFTKREVGAKCQFKAVMALMFANNKPDGQRRAGLAQSATLKHLTGTGANAKLRNMQVRMLQTRKQLDAIRSGVMLPEADALRRWLAR